MKKSSIAGLFCWILFTAFAVFVSVFTVPDYVSFLTGDIPMVNELVEAGTDGSLESGYAKIQIDATLGSYATYTETSNFVTRKTEYYIAWLPDGSFMTVTIPVKKIHNYHLDEITWSTWDYINGATDRLTGEYVELKGEIKDLDNDARRLFEDTLNDYGFSENDYYFRDQVLECSASPVLDVVIMLLIVAVLWLISILWIAFLVKGNKENRKNRLIGIEPSAEQVGETGISKEEITGADIPEISEAEALSRIKNKSLLETLKINNLVKWGSAVLTLVTLFVMGLLFYRTNIYVATGDAAYAYDLTDEQDMARAGKYDIAKLTIDSLPDLGNYASGSAENDYIVTSGGKFYIATISESDIDRIREEVKTTGSSKLYGFLGTNPANPREECIDALNNLYGTTYNYSDYNEVFGKYTIYVKPDYNGAGIGGDIIIIIYVFAVLLFFLGLVMFFSCRSERKLAVKRMRAMTDMQYAAFEESLEKFEAGFPGTLEKIFKK